MGKRVLLGMSGGVDSSVSAILLKNQGYDVIGITMRLWEENTEEQESSSAIYDAKKVCEKLGIPHDIMDARAYFQEKVIEPFKTCYQNCQTPNPCVECNRYLKFGVFYEKARELGCDYIATGHYAKVEYSDEYGRYVLKRSNSLKKDQTYFLYGISPEILEKIIFPLADYTDKEQIREIAEKHGLVVAKKKDSQEICFIPDGDYANFLQRMGEVKEKAGNIVLKDGTILGKHKGLMHYTIGQRKGLGVAYRTPLYVIGMNQEKNEVIVGEESELYTDCLYAEKVNLLAIDEVKEPMEVKAKIRYRAEVADAVLYPKEDGRMKVVFQKKQRAITPGQSVVFYQEDIVIGGGKIVREGTTLPNA